MTRRGRFLGLTLVVFALACAVALAPATARADGKSIVRGTVLDASTGRAAVGARWDFYRHNPDNSWSLSVWGDVGADGSVYAEVPEDGSFAFFVYGGEGYHSIVYRNLDPPAELLVPPVGSLDSGPNQLSVGALDGANLINLKAGDSVVLDTISLRPEATPYGAIAGRIYSRVTGVGLGSDLLYLYRLDPATQKWVEADALIQPNSNGTYKVVGTAQYPLTGDIRLKFGMGFERITPGWFPDADNVDDARTIHVNPGDSLEGVDIGCFQDGNISGDLLWAETKTPAVNSLVESGWTGSYPGPDGHFIQTGVYPGKYSLMGEITGDAPRNFTWLGQSRTSKGAASFTLPSTGSVWGKDIWFSKHPAVAGTVRTAAGDPFADLLVTVYRKASGSWKAVGQDYTDQNGRYSVVCPSSGTYTVKFTNPGGTSMTNDDQSVYLGGGSSLGSAKTVGVGSSMASVRNFVMPQKADVRAERDEQDDPVAIALNASRSGFADGSCGSVVLASDQGVSGVTAPTLASALNAPLLLTDETVLRTEVLPEFDRLGVQTVYVVGTPTDLSLGQDLLLEALGYDVIRLGGSDVCDVSAAVARTIGDVSSVTTETPVFLVSSADPSTALAVEPAAVAAHGIVLVTGPTSTPFSIQEAVASLGITSVISVGSPATLPSGLGLAALTPASMSVARVATEKDATSRAASFAAYARSRGWAGDTNIGLVNASGYAQALAASGSLGGRSGVLLFTSPKSLPGPSAAIIAGSAAARRIRVYGNTKAVTAQTLIAAGSARLPVVIRLYSTPRSVRHGHAFRVAGTVSPGTAIAQRSVRIYLWRYAGGKWKSSGYVSTALAGDGSYSATPRLARAGKWRLRVRYAGDSVYALGWSSGYRAVAGH